MTIRELYNKLLTEYPTYKNYITYGDYLDIYVTDDPIKQDITTRFFWVSEGVPNNVLLFFGWDINDFKSTEIEDVGINGAEPRDKFGSIPEIYEHITTLWPNYEAAIQYFNEISKNIPQIVHDLQELGFTEIYGGSDVPTGVYLSMDQAEIEILFPDLYNLGHRTAVYRDGDCIDHYESKNINDCLTYLVKED